MHAKIDFTPILLDTLEKILKPIYNFKQKTLFIHTLIFLESFSIKKIVQKN